MMKFVFKCLAGVHEYRLNKLTMCMVQKSVKLKPKSGHYWRVGIQAVYSKKA